MTGLAPAFAHRGVTAERPLPGGHRNEVWLVRRGETLLVAKTTRHGEASLQWLSPVLAAARRAGLGAPPLIPDSDGRLAGGGLTLEPFVEGARPDCVAFHALAPRIRRFHALTAGIGPRPGPAYDARGMLARLPSPVAAQVRAALATVPPARRTVIHGDLGPANVLMTPMGPVLLDWDEARFDHPAHDLPLAGLSSAVRRARLAREILSGWTTEPGHARRMTPRLRWPARA